MENIGKTIEIIECKAIGRQFSNLKPGTKHILIPPPKGRKRKELWVMGDGEPVRLLFGEFKIVG